MQDLSLIGLGGIQLDVMGFRRLHQQEISRLQRISAALNMKYTGASDKIIKLRVCVGMQVKIVWVWRLGQTVGKIKVPVTVFI